MFYKYMRLQLNETIKVDVSLSEIYIFNYHLKLYLIFSSSYFKLIEE